ncbi:MAG: hypothetical protein AB7R69_00595 [Candidatus Babeliales bacterium]
MKFFRSLSFIAFLAVACVHAGEAQRLSGELKQLDMQLDGLTQSLNKLGEVKSEPKKAPRNVFEPKQQVILNVEKLHYIISSEATKSLLDVFRQGLAVNPMLAWTDLNNIQASDNYEKPIVLIQAMGDKNALFTPAHSGGYSAITEKILDVNHKTKKPIFIILSSKIPAIQSNVEWFKKTLADQLNEQDHKSFVANGGTIYFFTTNDAFSEIINFMDNNSFTDYNQKQFNEIHQQLKSEVL